MFIQLDLKFQPLNYVASIDSRSPPLKYKAKTLQAVQGILSAMFCFSLFINLVGRQFRMAMAIHYQPDTKFLHLLGQFRNRAVQLLDSSH